LSGLDWAGRSATASYSTSKPHLTALSAAIARLFPHLVSNAVDPGWVPTRMGGRLRTPHPAVSDKRFQDALLAQLAEHTGVTLGALTQPPGMSRD
jgi:NAD(P)-dependent dehydrogenase (short-subunit alcohol dehydrogenase family)